VCEFRFGQSSGWDWTVPGRLHERIRDRFPLVRQVAAPAIVIGEPGVRPPEQVERLQFVSQDGSRLVQSGPGLLSVNVLTRYPGWETFLDLIVDIFRHHADLLPRSQIQRIGLRYINRVDTKGKPETEFLAALPDIGKIFGSDVRTFYERYDLNYSDPVGTLIFQTGTVLHPHQGLMIDLDFSRDDMGRPGEDELERWLGRAHDKIEEVFVSSLTERARDLLGLELGA
jgi:uncharacterized protein (TIGR04255 family)